MPAGLRIRPRFRPWGLGFVDRSGQATGAVGRDQLVPLDRDPGVPLDQAQMVVHLLTRTGDKVVGKLHPAGYPWRVDQAIPPPAGRWDKDSPLDARPGAQISAVVHSTVTGHSPPARHYGVSPCSDAPGPCE
jgi:hypothetical protein